MNVISRRLGLISLCLACALFGSILTGVAFASQPHMWAALNNLKSARTQLIAATDDKAGHRGNAIRLIDQAIAQVNLGIAAGRK